MKELKINQLKIKDWCVFENMVINPKNVTKVMGDNETGKSTIGSSITWVLNGTDIEGNPLNDVLPAFREESLSPTVTLDMSVIDDKGIERPVTIEKCFKANFNRAKEYTGEHANSIKLNDVTVTQKKLDEWVRDNICDVEVFRMLSNIKVFTEKLKTKGKELQWQVQRRIIASLVKDMMDEFTMVQSIEKYELLKDGILRHKTSTEYLKQLKQQSSELQKSNDDYGLTLSLKKQEMEEVKYTIAQLNEMETKTKAKFNEVTKANQEYREKQVVDSNKDVLDKIKYLQIENDSYKDEYNKKYREYEKSLNENKKTISNLNENKMLFPTRIDSIKEKIKKIESEKVIDTCEYCGSILSEDRIAYNTKLKRNEVEQMQSNIEDFKNNLVEIEVELKKNEEKLAKLVEPKLNKQVELNNALISELQEQLVEIKPVTDMEDYQEKIQALTRNLSIIALARKSHENNARIEKQIADMQENHKQSMKKSSELQMLHDLCKEFISYYCGMIETKANELFAASGISFKMFKDLKTSDEPKETFEIYFNGKEYHKQLSYSTKMVVSFRITQALQEAYGVRVPVIVDNAESIALETILSDLSTQAILLSRVEEKCHVCGTNSVRRGVNGLWKCSCGNEWAKELIIK